MLRRIALEHRLTLVPWLLGVTSLAALFARLFARQRGLEARLERLAVTDDLTALFNRRFFNRALQREIAHLHRSRSGFSLLLIDLDDLMSFRDARGQHAGDEALRLAARTLTASVRETDLVARYGDETFAVLAMGADPIGAIVLGEKLRARLESAASLRACVGVATFAKDGRRANDLIAAADLAVGRARRDAEKRVCAA